MAQQIQLRRDTALNWEIVNPVLAEGEAGVELDTLKIKIGDGVSEWNDLDYIPGSEGGDMLKILYDNNEDGIVDDSDRLGGELPSHYATASALDDKVDKVTGKGLSTEDYTSAEKTKLSGIAEGANNYTHPANHDPSIIAQDTNNRFATDAEKTTWNNKSDLALGELSTNAYRGDRGKTAYDHTSLTNNPHSVDKTQVGLSDVTNNAQVKKRASSTSGNIPSWNGANGDALTDGYSVESTLIGGSTALVRADAIKAYVDGLIGANDAMVYKGAIDCSENPNYSAGHAGWTWKVSASGKIGGASGLNVEVGDMIICTVDDTESGNHATVGANFNIIQVNIDGAVIGPASSTNDRLAAFDGISGKLIKDSGYSPSSFAASTHVGATGDAHGAATTEVNGFMSSTDKLKLNGVAENANNYTHPANHDPSIITQDTNNRFVTDAEKTTWNNKSNLTLGETDSTAYRGDRGKTAYDHTSLTNNPHGVDKTQVGLSNVTNVEQAPVTHVGATGNAHGAATTSVDGFMSSTDKSKLDGVAANANNYTHPENHPPSIITQDTNNRFVTDAEKTTWNNKSNLALGETDSTAYRGDRGKTAYDHTSLTNNPHSVDKTQVGLSNVTNDAQVKKLAESTSGKVPTWNGTTGDALNDGYSVETTLTGGSTALARADAIKSYIDTLLGANDAMVYKGAIDCSENPNYSAGHAGWTWKVSVAGKIGGASGPNVEVGDMIICTADDTPSGNHATVGSNFNIIQVNIDGAVIGPASSVTNRLAAFDGISGKLIKDSGYLASDFAASTHVGATGAAHGVVTTDVNGFMSSSDKTKLNGIAENANNYSHPANHDPSIITQDTNNRFVTDAEKTTWNNKSNLALGETDSTAYRGDRGKTAYDHSQSAHAPSNAQKNSDITKEEIEAKLTGSISSHSHTGLAPGAHASTHITGGSDIIANATTDASGLMSSTDKTKLNGVAENANNYTHPANHDPSIITQDTNNRFVTDAEKTTWNNKSNLALGETDSTAYRGDRGKTAYDHTALTNNPHSVTKTQVNLGNVTDDAQVKKRVSSTNGNIPTWNGVTGDALNDGYGIETTLSGGSGNLARADAIKAYVDGLIGANDAMVYKGAIDCSGNPNYSAGDAGHTWKVSVAGKIGGASGPNVEVGDMVICTVDGTASGTHAAVGANFNIIQVNIDGAVIGPASSTTNRLAAFDGISGKLIKDSGYLASDFAASSHVGATGAAHGAATTSVNGFMSSTDKTKLDGVANNANNYTHPANHDPSIITQDTNNRFVTDAEKTTWNNKSNLALGETDSTAYRGDRGKTAYDHTSLTNNPHGVDKTQVGLSNVTNVAQVAKSGDTMTGTLNLPANGLQVGTDQLKTNDGKVGVNTSAPLSSLGIKGKITFGTYNHSSFSRSSSLDVNIFDSTVESELKLQDLGSGYNPTINIYGQSDTLPASGHNSGVNPQVNIWNDGATDYSILRRGLFYGSSVSGGNLTIDSTIHGTKGNVILNSSGGNVGIGTSSPEDRVDINGNARIRQENSMKFGGTGASDAKFEIKYNASTETLDFNFIGA